MKSNTRKIGNGLALAIIQSSDKAGEINIKATSPGLKEARIRTKTIATTSLVIKY
ncbi:MAG: hypothetical protein ABI688_00730 [Bacteroidota bacterium]